MFIRVPYGSPFPHPTHPANWAAMERREKNIDGRRSECRGSFVRAVHLIAWITSFTLTWEATDRPHPEEKLTTTPRLALTMAGTKCRIMFAVPLIFTSTTRSNSSWGTSQRFALSGVIPALLRRNVGAPNSAILSWAHFLTSVSCITSTTENLAVLHRLFSFSTLFADRPHPSTVWPLAANHFAISRPRPCVTPVMTITSPAMFSQMPWVSRPGY